MVMLGSHGFLSDQLQYQIDSNQYVTWPNEPVSNSRMRMAVDFAFTVEGCVVRHLLDNCLNVLTSVHFDLHHMGLL